MKKRNIVIIIILLILIIGISTFFILKNIREDGRNYEIEEIKDYSYFVLNQDGKYGVIDKEANIIIEPKYDSVKIPNPSKAVFVCGISEEQNKVLNENQEEIFTNYDNVECISLKNIASSLMYEKSVLKYEKDGKYGLIDFNGNEITSNIYENIEGLKYKEGELQVTKDGKLGIINIKGNELVEIEYDKVDVDAFYQEGQSYKLSGYIVGNKTDEGYRYGYISVDGEELLKTEYNEISRINDIKNEESIYLIASKNGQYGLTKNGENILNFEYQSINYDNDNSLLIIEKSKKYGVSDINGNIIVPVQYSQIDIAGNNLYVTDTSGNKTVLDNSGNSTEINFNISYINVENTNYKIVIDDSNDKTLYGVVDNNNNELIKAQYSYIEYLFDNYFLISNEQGKLGVVDDNGQEKIEAIYNSLQQIKDMKLIQASITGENNIIIYSANAEIICQMQDATVTTNEDYIKVSNATETKYISNLGTELTNKEIYTNNTLFAQNVDGKWGFVDSNGNVKIQCAYDKVTEFNEYGYAGIKKDGKWGVINEDGTIIAELKYEFKDNSEPEFLGAFYKVIYGFGEYYYTNS